ncbi:thiamine phosphate synthase [Hymenobacter sp. UV11]|uniref:thiamine phosphate synthase n=1 Tax=Hymenobacter sp. UV11 TaxID=1849735 RepID=UPI00105D4D45|nr:thiamine phosphate synthase [Hymenobacter sp. UV11]TDN40071.1 thiamine-phosphate diphosphorylase [Hymenobacter sp. UV11]TFZ64013.1 thiamine phosphate synthase [Hymenobacter sp. UV11]
MKISNLHYITTTAAAAELACRGGVRWVQLRVKNLPAAEWRQRALDAQAVCRHHGATLILNDNPALAREIGADGVHLGKQDMPPAEARALLGPGFLIGGTANTFADIEGLVAAGVDYVGLGPFRFTTTKEKLSPILGLASYTEILGQCRAAGFTVPIIGIGGVGLADVPALRATGLHGVAVSGAIGGAADPRAAARLFVGELIANQVVETI